LAGGDVEEFTEPELKHLTASHTGPKEALNWFAEKIYKYLRDKGYKTSWEPNLWQK